MPRLFHANFEFEHELAGNLGEARDTVRRLTGDLAVAWLCMAEPGDAILLPEQDPVPQPVNGVGFTTLTAAPRGCDWEYVPWGWTAERLARAERHGWTTRCPPLDVVRRINHRSFRFELEQELGIAIAGSSLATSLEEVSTAVAALPGKWVVKAGYGMAGREQWRGQGRLDSTVTAGVARRLAISGSAIVEPWLDAIAEAGIQVDVPRDGPPRFLEVIPQLVDSFGIYRGSRFSSAEDRAGWDPAIEIALRVAGRVQELGYFGPLGIDCMRHRQAGDVRLRPLQDLNARWTMGRMAHHLSERLPEGACGSWLLLRWAGTRREWDRWVELVRSKLPAGTEVQELSIPILEEVSGKPRSRRITVMITAPDPDSRKLVEQRFVSTP